MFELVLALILTGILALVQIRAFSGVHETLLAATEKSVASSVQASITAYFLDPTRGNLKFPSDLDAEAPGQCSEQKKCFDKIMPGGIAAYWKKISDFKYQGRPGGREWTYNPVKGVFLPEEN